MITPSTDFRSRSGRCWRYPARWAYGRQTGNWKDEDFSLSPFELTGEQAEGVAHSVVHLLELRQGSACWFIGGEDDARFRLNHSIRTRYVFAFLPMGAEAVRKRPGNTKSRQRTGLRAS